MTPLGWLFIILMLVITGFAIAFAWFCSAELDRVQQAHARHGAPARPATARHDATREPRTSLLTSDVTPQEWQSYVNAGRAVEPVRTGEHPPWTGSQPALTDEVIDQMRGEYQASYLREHDAMPALRQPVYGETAQLEIEPGTAGQVNE